MLNPPKISCYGEVYFTGIVPVLKGNPESKFVD